MTENRQVESQSKQRATSEVGIAQTQAGMDIHSAAGSQARLGGATILITLLLMSMAAGKAVLFSTLDPDCFWHLRVAEQLRTHGIGPLIDHLSFSSMKSPWTPYSWLAELFMKWVWDTFTWRGVIVTQAIIQGMFAAILMRCCLTLSRGRLLASAVATFLGLFCSLPFLSFRPVTFSLLPIGLCAWLILRDRQLRNNSRAIWWTIPLTILATNLHLSACFVPLWFASLAVGNFVSGKPSGRMLYFAFATAFACACTPMLPGAIATSIHYAGHDAMVASPIIAEMRSFYAGTTGAIYLVLVLMLVYFAWRKCNENQAVSRGEWIWLVISAVLIGKMGRFAVLFVLIASATVSASANCVMGF